ncbi:MAG: (2Fe-2S)-binding protein [Candidatus Solibacter usitatus]|nr:(2Fe-2S)-binding protein [Candidatus Solibacter usitatus]
MAERVTIFVDGRPIAAERGATVAAAMLSAGIRAFRHSVSGEPRAPLCGMGICFECRVTIGGEPHRRGCQTLCQDGLEVSTT